MEITKVLILGVVCCFFCVLLSQFRPEYSMLVQLGSVAVTALLLADQIMEIFAFGTELTECSGINKEYIFLLVKAALTAVCGKVVCDFCCDYGNRAIASCVDLACRISILLLAMPLLKVLLQLTTDLIKNEN